MQTLCGMCPCKEENDEAISEIKSEVATLASVARNDNVKVFKASVPVR